MASPRNRRHLLVPGTARVDKYTAHSAGPPTKKQRPQLDRVTRGHQFKASLATAIAHAKQYRLTSHVSIQGSQTGTYLEFESTPGHKLDTKSFDIPGKHIELLAVTDNNIKDKTRAVDKAIVFVPEESFSHIEDRFEKYAQNTIPKKGARRYEKMLDPVNGIAYPPLRSFWTDAPEAYPAENETIWWEVWLRRHDGQELERLMEFAGIQNISVAPRRLQFTESIVVLVKASESQLSPMLGLNDLAELQLAKETATVFENMRPAEQAMWVDDLLSRITWPEEEAPVACILDTGITRAHPLLKGAIAETDCHAINDGWGLHDNGGGPQAIGHGTAMAGLTLFGDLVPQLTGNHPIVLRHRVASVKILPPEGENDKELYSAITAKAIGLAEGEDPDRIRCFSMAITTKDNRDRGRPTSWSTAIDALAAGQNLNTETKELEFTNSKTPGGRLIIVSAGNIRANLDDGENHLDRSDLAPILDPGQSWNALTVGAYTEKVLIANSPYLEFEPVARRGELSPFTTTSVTFQPTWPLKPDVVFEGGNMARSPAGGIAEKPPDLLLLTTNS